MHYPPALTELIAALKALPGVGPKTAERYAFHMLDWSPKQLALLSKRIEVLQEQLVRCECCGCLLDKMPCSFCDTERRLSELFCVVASPKDVFSIEATGLYRGCYHVLGGLLSPLDGRGPQTLTLHRLKARLQELKPREVILALDSTLEGDTTALYLKDELASDERHVSRLALGIPLGSPLDFIDGGTLARALSGRHTA